MLNILMDCNDIGILKVIYFIKIVLNILKIVVPIFLIISCMITAIKNVTSSKGFDSKLIKNMGIKMLAAVFVFLVPSILNITLSILDQQNFQLSSCWKNATKEVMNMESESQENSNDLNLISNKIEESLLKRNCINKNYRKNHKKECEKYGASFNDVEEVDYPEEVVENLAAFIGSEAGWSEEGLLSQLMTGAVYINNFYALIGGEINKNSMCQLFSYRNVYASYYCNYKLSTLESRGIDEKGKEHLKKVSKILLSKQFTIPKDVRFEAADYVIKNSNGIIWGRAYTGVSAYPYVYFGYSSYDNPIDTVDAYGNSTSTNFDDYKNKADELLVNYF